MDCGILDKAGDDDVTSDTMTQSQESVIKDDESWSDISDFQKIEDDFYSSDQINAFLDETKGKKVDVTDFPDVDKFIASVYYTDIYILQPVVSAKKAPSQETHNSFKTGKKKK